jgi:hypothetical protein
MSAAGPASPRIAPYEDIEGDEWEDRRSPTQWLCDVALLPGLVLFVTTMLLLGTSSAVWAMFKTWAAIVEMINW